MALIVSFQMTGLTHVAKTLKRLIRLIYISTPQVEKQIIQFMLKTTATPRARLTSLIFLASITGLTFIRMCHAVALVFREHLKIYHHGVLIDRRP